MSLTTTAIFQIDFVCNDLVICSLALPPGALTPPPAGSVWRLPGGTYVITEKAPEFFIGGEAALTIVVEARPQNDLDLG